MNLAYKKILGKFTKVLGFGKTPPPHVGKNSQIISFFFWERTLPNMTQKWPLRVKNGPEASNGVKQTCSEPLKWFLSRWPPKSSFWHRITLLWSCGAVKCWNRVKTNDNRVDCIQNKTIWVIFFFLLWFLLFWREKLSRNFYNVLK